MESSDKFSSELIYGIHPIIEALEAGKTFDKIFILNTLKSAQVHQITAHAKSKKISLNRVPFEKLQKLTRNNHQGVVAFVSPIEFFDLDVILRKIEFKGEKPFLVVLDRIQDVRNFGAIVRSAECAGAHAVVIPKKGAAHISSETVKTSAGALYNIPICKVAGVDNALEEIKAAGIKLVACTEKFSENYTEFNYDQPVAIVMGSEESGIAVSNIRKCDFKAGIPLLGKTESLNVSVAAGILMYEVVKQRNLG